MPSSFYLLQVALSLTSYLNLSQLNIPASDGDLLRFRVYGESKLVIITSDVPDKTVQNLLKVNAEIISLDCNLLLPYETFAANSLNVDKNLTIPSGKSFSNDTKIFWFHTQIGYEGFSRDDFISIWRTEATTALTLQKNTPRRMQLFKVVAENTIMAFIEVAGTVEADGLFWNLPLVSKLGQNMNIKAREVHLI